VWLPLRWSAHAIEKKKVTIGVEEIIILALELFMLHLWTFVMKGVRVCVSSLPMKDTPLFRCILFAFAIIFIYFYCTYCAYCRHCACIVYSQHIFTPTQIAEQSARLFARGSWQTSAMPTP